MLVLCVWCVCVFVLCQMLEDCKCIVDYGSFACRVERLRFILSFVVASFSLCLWIKWEIHRRLCVVDSHMFCMWFIYSRACVYLLEIQWYAANRKKGRSKKKYSVYWFFCLWHYFRLCKNSSHITNDGVQCRCTHIVHYVYCIFTRTM